MKDFIGSTSYDDVLKKAQTLAPRCYESHPALEIGEYKIYGGSCSHPAVLDADIYIGLDHSARHTTGAYPWHNKRIEIYFPITDMTAPKDADEFRNMVEWTALQLIAGKKVHVGCIGGHGRTGTFLAALVKHMTGNKDAIKYVRENYCEKAVETDSQINFLHKQYGITKVKSTKGHFKYSTDVSFYNGKDTAPFQSEASKLSKYSSATGPKSIFPVVSKKSIWLAKK